MLIKYFFENMLCEAGKIFNQGKIMDWGKYLKDVAEFHQKDQGRYFIPF